MGHSPPPSSSSSSSASTDRNVAKTGECAAADVTVSATPSSASSLHLARSGFVQDEIVRLMTQCLRDLGFSKSMDMLQRESGVQLEQPTISQFRNSVLEGRWEEVDHLLTLLHIPSFDVINVKFLIGRQKYLELLEVRKVSEALVVLRKHLTPLGVSPKKIHALSRCLMVSGNGALLAMAKWDGAQGSSRHELLKRLQSYIPSSIMLPECRLLSLIDQAVDFQKFNCLFHISDGQTVSLFKDHSCDRSEFPNQTTHILEQHSDEVWFVAYSRQGQYLASASKDATAIIWSVFPEYKAVHVLSGHKEAISFLAWSPDDSGILTASNDCTLRLWNAKTGTCLYTYAKHTESVTSCSWLPDGSKFLSGSLEKTIYLWSTDGTILHRWTGIRVMDLVATHEGAMMIATSEKKIRIYALWKGNGDSVGVGGMSTPASAPVAADRYGEILSLQESDSITSLYISADGRFLLVNLSIQEIHLWDIQEHKLLRKYIGQKQGRFVIRSCFGGSHENFILSGSEDASVYVWHREHGMLIDVLSGHTGCVNCVAWNSGMRSPMFASASDDHTIRIWGPSQTGEGVEREDLWLDSDDERS